MGLLNAVIGNVSELQIESIQKEYSEILCDGEVIEKAFKLIRDKWVFTDKRLIIQDIQGMTGRKREYHSIPYRSIVHFSVESAGTFDMDSEMKIWVRGLSAPLQQKFGRSSNIGEIQRILAKYVL